MSLKGKDIEKKMKKRRRFQISIGSEQMNLTQVAVVLSLVPPGHGEHTRHRRGAVHVAELQLAPGGAALRGRKRRSRKVFEFH